MRRQRRVSVMAGLMLAVTASVARADVCHDLVTVGNGGYAADRTGGGTADYVYAIGNYDVTAGGYTRFLNAVEATDAHWLYCEQTMSALGCQVEQSGSSGSYVQRGGGLRGPASELWELG